MTEERLTVEQILGAIRASGGRITATKRALVTALAASRHHLTVEDLTSSVQRHAPATSPSSVYRNLEELEQLGIVEHAHLGRSAAVYHLTGPVHGHLLCSRCGLTIEVPSATFDTLVTAAQRNFGFEVDRHHLGISGLCSDCRISAATS